MIAGSETRDGIDVSVDESDDYTQVAVRVVDSDLGDYSHAAVRLFYRTTLFPDHSVVVSRVDLVPLMGEAFTLVSFPVVLADAEFVRVELMQCQGRRDFFRPGGATP